MNKKGVKILSAICFFVCAMIFFVMLENTALGICFAVLGVGGFVRCFGGNKSDDENGK